MRRLLMQCKLRKLTMRMLLRLLLARKLRSPRLSSSPLSQLENNCPMIVVGCANNCTSVFIIHSIILFNLLSHVS
jgi:hypothetical protein